MCVGVRHAIYIANSIERMGRSIPRYLRQLGYI